MALLPIYQRVYDDRQRQLLQQEHGIQLQVLRLEILNHTTPSVDVVIL
jgi:hypothetical protein